jgi:hypothetical protein
MKNYVQNGDSITFTAGATITGNAVTSVDNQPLFHSSHKNFPGSAASINTAGINAMRKLMRTQKDIADNTINLTPSYMLVPTDLEAAALQCLFRRGRPDGDHDREARPRRGGAARTVRLWRYREGLPVHHPLRRGLMESTYSHDS